MSAHVVLGLFNELRKSDKKRCLPSILSLFRNKFNKFNNARVRVLDSIYHMLLKLIKNRIFYRKNIRILPLKRRNWGLSILLHGVILLSDGTS